MMRTKNVKQLNQGETSPFGTHKTKQTSDTPKPVRDRGKERPQKVLRSGFPILESSSQILEQPSTFKNLGEPVVCTKVRFIGGEKKNAAKGKRKDVK